MGFFGLFKAVAGNAASISVLTNGSDILINRHTKVNTFSLNRAVLNHANAVIKHAYLNNFMDDMREEEAAMLKLAVFYKAAEQGNEQQIMALLADSITTMRRVGGENIRPQISLQVRGETGC